MTRLVEFDTGNGKYSYVLDNLGGVHSISSFLPADSGELAPEQNPESLTGVDSSPALTDCNCGEGVRFEE